MEFLSNYLPFRSACLKNLKKQIFPKNKFEFVNEITTRSKVTEENVKHMVEKIASHGMFFNSESNMGLYNFLENKQATPEQSHDMMSLRAIGQQAFEAIANSTFLNKSSTAAPTRKKRIRTFTITKVQKQRNKQLEKERKLFLNDKLHG